MTLPALCPHSPAQHLVATKKGHNKGFPVVWLREVAVVCGPVHDPVCFPGTVRVNSSPMLGSGTCVAVTPAPEREGQERWGHRLPLRLSTGTLMLIKTPGCCITAAGQLIAFALHSVPDTQQEKPPETSSPRPRQGQPMGSNNLSSPVRRPSPPAFLSPSAFPTVRESQVEGCTLIPSSTLTAFMASFLCIEFVLGLVGNTLAFLIFCFYTRPWTSNTVLLVCLVLADFLLVINLPLRVDYYLFQEEWRFGTAACQVNLFMISSNRTASVVFLAAIALNRYLKVVWPHHVLSRASVGAAALGAGGLWGVILLLNVHLLQGMSSSSVCLSYQLGTNSSAWHRWHEALFVLEFSVTLALILFSTVSIWRTIRRQGLEGQAGLRRAMHVLLLVVAGYTICFLPSFVFGIMTVVAFELHACHAFNTYSRLFHSSLAFTYLNSVLDPVLYCFSSPNFLHQMRLLLGMSSSSQGSSSNENSYVAPARRLDAPRQAKEWRSAVGEQ
ncbi:PREDICTED: oxoeicosanoid receptor 1 [Elephantulus edwardii]|uniref:oxoeicosanoid receptor 1 n=1 Tax=Elephantulus edwardii TaxID=28737 RepID=UPI0003F0BE95|nr:PREDICTED: oxoeicosanoid receptor 1 [Elephantulus edwardii]